MTVPIATTTKVKPKASPSVKKPVKPNASPCTAILQMSFMIFGLFLAVGGYYLSMYNSFIMDFVNTHFVRNNGEYVMSSLDDRFSTLFCEKYTVHSGDQADVFLVDNGAKVSGLFREIVTLRETDAVSESSYAYFSSYLLAGSTIKVKGCRAVATPTEAKILLIKGDDSWKSWKNTRSESTCVKAVDIKQEEVCDFERLFDLDYEVASNDNYYIVIDQGAEYKPGQETFVSTLLNLNKTIYDLRQTSNWCENTKECTLHLKFSSDQDIIVKYPQKQRTYLTSFNGTCQKRLTFWLGIFVALPSTIVLLLSACACCCHAAEKRERKKTKKRTIVKALVDNNPEPVRPPSYEVTTKPLPSYSVDMNV